ncbi:hypothetical protein J5500_00160 [Candidatus Saccharibacteria bacterium]|nr:hypothetical protein [Candidatus Saccharibacteria bacterium]
MHLIGYLDPEHFFEGYIGDFCHVDWRDGGHVRIRLTRSGAQGLQDLNEAELSALGGAIQRLSNALISALTEYGIPVRRVNVQINNNWSDLYSTEPSFCVHIYGRAYDAKAQPLGQALFFPSPRENPDFYKDNEPLPLEVIQRIQELL